MRKIKIPRKILASILATICVNQIKELPDKTSKNSKRLQFALKIFTLIIYGACNRIYCMPIWYHRTAEQQEALYDKGRTDVGRIVTNKDGVYKKSEHQFWLAMDFVVLRFKGKSFLLEWKDKTPYEILGKFWVEKLGGTWGGVWERRDYGHFEL